MNTLFQEKLIELIDEGLKTDCYPAAACAIGVGDTLLAKYCVGEYPIPGGSPVDEHTRWDMASMSKVLGPTMVALQGLQNGDFSLDDTIGSFFPWAPDDKKQITIRMLMTHTAGFHPSFRLDQELTDPADTLSCILHHPLVEEPGKRPIYTCMGYITFGKILEKIYGEPLKELARKRVFEPLGMTETCYCPPEGTPCVATEVDPLTGKPWIGVVHDENARFQNGNSANAGVFMSLKDGITFAKCMARMGAPLIGWSMMEQAIQNLTPNQDTCRGLGFQVTGNPDCVLGAKLPFCFGHTGFTGTSMLVEPVSGFWIMLLTNRVYPTRDNPRHGVFRKRLHEEMWAFYEAHREELEPSELACLQFEEDDL